MRLEALLNLFRTPSANVLALRELENAKRELLGAYSAQEYATAMCAYNQDRVARLEQHIKAIS